MTIIQVDQLEKHYGDTVALAGVDLRVAEGEIFGILGRNGAGKTTLVECIEGLRIPDGGRISVAGLAPRRDRRELRRVLGAQLQDSRLPAKLRVGEALRLYRSFYRDGEDPDRLLAALGLTDKRDAAFEQLSGGQQQRLSAALALVGAPRIAILDELTTGLDPQARREAWALIRDIRSRGVTILLVTHFMDEAERLCDRVAVIDHGEVIAAGTPAQLIRTVADTAEVSHPPASLEDAFVALTDHPQGGESR